MDRSNLQQVSKQFLSVIEQQLNRIEKIKKSDTWINYQEVSPIIIGMIGGDGIGPIISDASRDVLEELLSEEKQLGKILFKDIQPYFGQVVAENKKEDFFIYRPKKNFNKKNKINKKYPNDNPFQKLSRVNFR